MIAVLVLACLGMVLGALLGFASERLKVEENPMEEELKAMLPGSQCGQCGYVGCGQAAAALARGEATVTLCPPGGRSLAEALAKKLGVTADLSDHVEKGPEYAFVRAELCYGCTRCIPECNVDAIIGATKQMHDVIAELCHGCAKCVAVCPTDAIEMRPVNVEVGTWHWPKPHALAAAHA